SFHQTQRFPEFVWRMRAGSFSRSYLTVSKLETAWPIVPDAASVAPAIARATTAAAAASTSAWRRGGRAAERRSVRTSSARASSPFPRRLGGEPDRDRHREHAEQRESVPVRERGAQAREEGGLVQVDETADVDAGRRLAAERVERDDRRDPQIAERRALERT